MSLGRPWGPQLLETSPDHRHVGRLEVPHQYRQLRLPDAANGDALAVQHLGRHQGLTKSGFASLEIDSLDWFKGKSTGNHGFYHQI